MPRGCRGERARGCMAARPAPAAEGCRSSPLPPPAAGREEAGCCRYPGWVSSPPSPPVSPLPSRSYRCCAAGRGRRRARPGGRREPAGAARRAAGPWRGRRRGERVPANARPGPARPFPPARPPLPPRPAIPLPASRARPAPALEALSQRVWRRRGEEERGERRSGERVWPRRDAHSCGGAVRGQRQAHRRHSSRTKAEAV